MKHAFEKLRDYCHRNERKVMFGRGGEIIEREFGLSIEDFVTHDPESLAKLVAQGNERQCHKELLAASRDCSGHRRGPRLWAAIQASDKSLSQKTEKTDET